METFLFEKWIKITIPEKWNLEEGDGILTIYGDKGVGAMNISFIKRKKTSNNLKEDLWELLQNHINLKNINKFIINPEIDEEKSRYLIGKLEYLIEHNFWRIWFLLEDKRLLFITYNCDYNQSEHERDVVDKIIDSIKFT